MLERVADRAVDLQGGAGGQVGGVGHGHAGGGDVADRGAGVAGVLGDRQGSGPQQRAGHLQRDRDLGELVLERLVLADELAVLLALLGVVDAHREHGLAEPLELGRGAEGPVVDKVRGAHRRRAGPGGRRGHRAGPVDRATGLSGLGREHLVVGHRPQVLRDVGVRRERRHPGRGDGRERAAGDLAGHVPGVGVATERGGDARRDHDGLHDGTRHRVAAQDLERGHGLDRGGPGAAGGLVDEQGGGARLGDASPHGGAGGGVTVGPGTDHRGHVGLGQQGVDAGGEVGDLGIECELHDV